MDEREGSYGNLKGQSQSLMEKAGLGASPRYPHRNRARKINTILYFPLYLCGQGSKVTKLTKCYDLLNISHLGHGMVSSASGKAIESWFKRGWKDIKVTFL